MNNSILWKLSLSVVLLAWALLNIFPTQDTPFEDYVRQEATEDVEGFEALLERAKNKAIELDEERKAKFIEEGGVPEEFTAKTSLFVGLRTVLKESRDEEGNKIDFSRHFPDLDVSGLRNVDKRNRLVLEHLLKESLGNIKLGLDLNGGVALTYELDEAQLEGFEDFEQEAQIGDAIEIIRDRVDAYGVAEPVVRLKGEKAIEVQLPGLSTRDNPDIVDTLAKPATLEFSEVHRRQNPMSVNDKAPLGYVLKIEEREDKNGQITEVPVFIKRVPIMKGDIIKRAAPRLDELGRAYVSMKFTSEGGKIFGEETGRMAEENERTGTTGRLAIILDGKLMSSPTVRERLDGGSAIITGNFTQQEAMELSNVLNNPLKVQLDHTETFEVGPSLAKDSKDASLRAGFLGSLLVVLFMFIYYRAAGVVAVIALAMNLIVVIGTLASFGAAITLPGVAALVLTIGMGVDAQILIYERIREELKEGKTLKTALLAGFNKALSTIVDANVTTLITAIILIKLGSGPVKGFGVTLAIGIGASMFCALIVSRGLLELLVNTSVVKKMMTTNLLAKKKTFAFLDHRKRAFTTSWAIVAIGIITVFVKFDTIFGPDFRGGDEITVNYTQAISTGEIERVAAGAGIDFVNVSPMAAIGGEKDFLKIQTDFDKGRPLFKALAQEFPDAGLELDGETRIGATVSAEVKKSAIVSVMVALVGILLYVALRFEIGYGVGAVVATVHDVAMTIGIYVLLGGQFTAPMVAAILMIVGYSINDTIVVFDRIREELTLNPTAKLKDIVNKAINLTLSRTILTSATTLLATFSLWLFGAGVVIDYALVFIIGIMTGTFSSIFIASPIFYFWHGGNRRRVEETHDILPSYDWETGGKVSQ